MFHSEGSLIFLFLSPFPSQGQQRRHILPRVFWGRDQHDHHPWRRWRKRGQRRGWRLLWNDFRERRSTGKIISYLNPFGFTNHFGFVHYHQPWCSIVIAIIDIVETLEKKRKKIRVRALKILNRGKRTKKKNKRSFHD